MTAHRDRSLFDDETPRLVASGDAFVRELTEFSWHGQSSLVSTTDGATSDGRVPLIVNEFWTSRQRAAHSLHEVSYRACFKPQLPRFFIDRLTTPGQVVYDPFTGRGTTMIEAALTGRIPVGCDINPLSWALIGPRLSPPSLSDVDTRLRGLPLQWSGDVRDDLLTFFHPETLRALTALRHYLLARQAEGTLDGVDAWIRMVTLNRLTGHSPGFLSVYTLPPNQAASVKAQQKINADRKQSPPLRHLLPIVLRKSRALLADLDGTTVAGLQQVRRQARFTTGSAATAFWPDESVHLAVTSPPFLDVVDYATDNWLRGWFCGVDTSEVPIAIHRGVDEWGRFIGKVLSQLHRLLVPGGYVAFEVGEVRAGKVRLEHTVLPQGLAAGLVPIAVMVNQQSFTKTANIWGVSNNAKGTNTNRIVVFQKQ